MGTTAVSRSVVKAAELVGAPSTIREISLNFWMAIEVEVMYWS
jgi:hypothetical protein